MTKLNSQRNFKIGDKVRVKRGLGMVSGKRGTIIYIGNKKALINFPYDDIREIYFEDLELLRR